MLTGGGSSPNRIIPDATTPGSDVLQYPLTLVRRTMARLAEGRTLQSIRRIVNPRNLTDQARISRTRLALLALTSALLAAGSGCMGSQMTRHQPDAPATLIDRRASPAHNLRVLAVVAHPDDETYFAGTVYRLARHFKSTVDVVVITNGEGGYKYADLAAPLYKLELSIEEIGRKHLPAIRKQEMQNAAEVLGIANCIFLDQKDDRFTTDEAVILNTGIWNLEKVRNALAAQLGCGYDLILTILPIATEHAAHKAATLLALEAVSALPEDRRPAILGAVVKSSQDLTMTERDANGRMTYEPPLGFSVAQLALTDPVYTFDRRATFGLNGRLDYVTIAIWDISAHRSQGASQKSVRETVLEQFHIYRVTPPSQTELVRQVFAELAKPPDPDMLRP